MNEEIQTIKSLIGGLEVQIESKESDEKLFNRAAGLETAAEKARGEIIDMETDLETIKENLAEKKSAKANALGATTKAMVIEMNKTLTSGTAILEISDEGVLIGWQKGGIIRPYHALSGSERICFDNALADAFNATILLYEAGDGVDRENLDALIKKLTGSDKQIILTHWFMPEEVPKGWKLVDLRKK